MVGMDRLKEYMQRQYSEDQQRTFVHVGGDTLEEALNAAAIELSIPLKRIEYEILEKGTKGVLGVGKRPYSILAYPAAPEQEPESLELSGDEDLELDGLGGKQRDGEALVRRTPQGVLLKVTKPEGGGRTVTENDALEVLQRRFDGSYDVATVAKVVKRADGEFVKVAEMQHDPSNDAMLTVNIVELDMKALLVAMPPGPGGADPEYEAIIGFLKANGVVEGIKTEAIERFVEKPEYNQPLLVAEGRRPRNGADARIVYEFETDSTRIKLKESEGRVDFKDLNIVQNVVAGQVVARKIPAEPAEPGVTVTGKVLPAEDGKDAAIQAGKNVKLSEDGRTAMAEINGQVVIAAGKINVEPVYVVNGNVSLKTGNILFLGTVVVKGHVEDGFDVKASGNIEVMGGVGKSNLDAEGDIIVHQGIGAKSEGTVRAGRNVWSKFIENAEVSAGDLVVVSDGIMNSHVVAQRKVICKGKRASIVGGAVRAAEEINAKSLGAVAGTETILEVGYDPTSKERLAALEQERGEYQKKLEELQRNLTTLENMRRQHKKLTKEKIENYKRLMKSKEQLTAETRRVAKEIQEIQEYLGELSTTGRISASATVFPGVKVYIKDAPLAVKNEFKAVSFVAEGDVVKVTKYQESDEDLASARKA